MDSFNFDDAYKNATDAPEAYRIRTMNAIISKLKACSQSPSCTSDVKYVLDVSDQQHVPFYLEQLKENGFDVTHTPKGVVEDCVYAGHMVLGWEIPAKMIIKNTWHPNNV